MCSAASSLTAASESAPSDATQSARRASSGRIAASAGSSSLIRPCARSLRESVDTRGVDARFDDVELGRDPVELAQHPVGGVAVVGGRRAGFDGSDPEFVEQRHETFDVGGRALHRVDERSSAERLVDVGDAPTGECGAAAVVSVSQRWSWVMVVLPGRGRRDVGRRDRRTRSRQNAFVDEWTWKPSRSYMATAVVLSASTYSMAVVMPRRAR